MIRVTVIEREMLFLAALELVKLRGDVGMCLGDLRVSWWTL